MKKLLWCLLLCACGSVTGPPEVPPDDCLPDTLGYCIFDCNGAYKPETPPKG